MLLMHIFYHTIYLRAATLPLPSLLPSPSPYPPLSLPPPTLPLQEFV
jgi:hypothetical protein